VLKEVKTADLLQALKHTAVQEFEGSLDAGGCVLCYPSEGSVRELKLKDTSLYTNRLSALWEGNF
jgi:hypothetical protein